MNERPGRSTRARARSTGGGSKVRPMDAARTRHAAMPVRPPRPRLADILITGRIATLAGGRGFGWVDALAVSGGRVMAVGTRRSVTAAVGRVTHRLDLPPDRIALPGLVDAHLHLAEAALAAGRVDLERADNLEAGLELINSAALQMADPAGWIEGGGWDPVRWATWPSAADLRRSAADLRVALWSHDHHALWVSDRVLRELGIDAATDDPPGGTIRRGADGEPTGVLQEAAAQLVARRLPPVGADALEDAIAAFARRLAALGLVGVHEPGDLLAEAGLGGGFGAVRRLADRGRLPLRVHASVRAPALPAAIDLGRRTGSPLGDDPRGRARMGWLKLFVDGALGSRTALLLDPYEGETGRGVMVTAPDELAGLVRQAGGAGIVSQVHAIGDAALRIALDALEPAAPRAGPMARVEHVQLAQPGDVRRLGRSRIAASVQPIHLATDRDKAAAAWGARADRHGFRLRSLLRAGATVAFGTDAPVEAPDPWPGIAIAVTRTGAGWSDPVPFGPSEGLGLAAAVRAATIGPAAVAGDRDRGRLVEGQRADLIVVPAASLTEPVTPSGPLATTRPDLVMIDGAIVHES